MKFYAAVIEGLFGPRLIAENTPEVVARMLASAVRTYADLELPRRVGPITEIEVPLAED